MKLQGKTERQKAPYNLAEIIQEHQTETTNEKDLAYHFVFERCPPKTQKAEMGSEQGQSQMGIGLAQTLCFIRARSPTPLR